MPSFSSTVSQLLAKSDRPGVRAFFLSLAALSIALILALYSGAAARLGNVFLASMSALTALLVAAWVGITLVPILAKRTPLRWIGYRMEYRVTRVGWIYIGAIVLVALAAINTGNNLLFLILATLIASILMSGILSSITLAGIELRLNLPEHIFAGQTVRATIELQNEKLTLPSFSLRVEGVAEKNALAAAVFETPVYFPYVARKESVRQSLPLLLPRRGVYRQEAFRIVTRFPFGFLQKARRLDLKTEALVYPSVEVTPEFLEMILGIQGATESPVKGRGQDLYALRNYLPTDSARHVHWKASARTGVLMVREFTREEDCRVLLVFDAHSLAGQAQASAADKDRFERAVALCAAIAWSFYERDGHLEFRSPAGDVAPSPSSQNIFAVLRLLALAQPLAPDPQNDLLPRLVAEPETVRILVTSRSHGSIPPEVWNTSYIVFAGDLSS